VFVNGTLSISDVDSADSGVYQCVGFSDRSSSSAVSQQTFATRLHLACESASFSVRLSLTVCLSRTSVLSSQLVAIRYLISSGIRRAALTYRPSFQYCLGTSASVTSTFEIFKRYVLSAPLQCPPTKLIGWLQATVYSINLCLICLLFHIQNFNFPSLKLAYF